MWTRWGDFNRSLMTLGEFRRRMDHLFDEWDRHATPAWKDGTWPPLNMFDAGNKLVIQAEVPGHSERDLDLTLNQNVLTIKGERKVDIPEGYAAHRQERGDITFARSLTLPCRIDPEKVAARVKDGLLTIDVEKAPEAKPRQITVKAS